MKIQVYRVPISKTGDEIVMHEDKKELLSDHAESLTDVKEGDETKYLAQIEQFNGNELNQARQMEGAQFILRKILTE